VIRFTNVQIKKERAGRLKATRTKPTHEIISPRKLGHETYLKSPP
jgi:hypothetical protein